MFHKWCLELYKNDHSFQNRLGRFDYVDSTIQLRIVQRRWIENKYRMTEIWRNIGELGVRLNCC